MVSLGQQKLLVRLHVRNILLLENAELDFKPGLNVLTGETGAGKSILLDCLGFLLGKKNIKIDVGRNGGVGEVTGVFELKDNENLRETLEELGFQWTKEVVVRRQLNFENKRKAFFNDTPCSVELLKILSAQAAISIDNSKFYSQILENQAWLDKLNKAYERFVPKQFLQFLDKESIVDVELGDQVQLKMSVLFSDVRNFTTMSEAMTPAENFCFINSFLSRMEPAILENQGFIDKYIGDAIMALFSGNADNAVKAGISMLNQLKEYNQYRANSGHSPVKIGVGINTGLLMLGTVGGQNRMDGTVISDAVNLASRVEGLTKSYGVSLLITEQTFSQLTQPSNYAIRSIDTLKVKGKSQKITVYEVFDADPPAVKEGKLNTLKQFQLARYLYGSGHSLEPRKMFAQCLKLNPRDQVAQIYLQRILSTSEK